MKKVRFMTIDKYTSSSQMDISECHSPRPFIIQQEPPAAGDVNDDLYARILQMKSDPLEIYESSNSSPYMVTKKTDLDSVCKSEPRIKPSNELELSMLDASNQEPRKQAFALAYKSPFVNQVANVNQSNQTHQTITEKVPVLASIENTEKNCPHNVLTKDNSFFIRRENVQMMQLQNTNILEKQFSKFTLDKENSPVSKKAKIMKMGIPDQVPFQYPNVDHYSQPVSSVNTQTSDFNHCNCHHCKIRLIGATIEHNHFHRNNSRSHFIPNDKPISHSQFIRNKEQISNQCQCSINCCTRFVQEANPFCINKQNYPNACVQPVPQNAVDKKTLTIQKYEQSTRSTDIEKPSAVIKEKREPTVADLFKIIKLQNEQLQLLQQKVDKFISSNNSSPANNPQPALPSQNYVTEHVALETIGNEHHKISIGVMTSFEMVRTSTVINKEILKQNNDQSAQVQCNRSQISKKEVALKPPVNQNFLDGISPVGRNQQNNCDSNDFHNPQARDHQRNKIQQQAQNVPEEKTLNELSLYNVQVDNSTTPMISPDQTMYLDVRDYSDTDSGSDSQSNVGWTYYNKVMTHVNGMLQDSDMPSSASALFRNARQKCVQMQIDKTNISITKRVKFGDDPFGLQQPHLQPATTDTSLKMNLLAAKYLKKAPQKQNTPRNIAVTSDEMSFATRNYMERHQILQGLPPPAAVKSPMHQVLPQAAYRTPTLEMPRFLDITALKQQSKLL